MTGTDTFTVLSFEDLEQVLGGLAIWDDGYIIESSLPIWAKEHLIPIEMHGDMDFQLGNIITIIWWWNEQTKTTWNVFAD